MSYIFCISANKTNEHAFSFSFNSAFAKYKCAETHTDN